LLLWLLIFFMMMVANLIIEQTNINEYIKSLLLSERKYFSFKLLDIKIKTK
jgi:hypothetical protein